MMNQLNINRINSYLPAMNYLLQALVLLSVLTFFHNPVSVQAGAVNVETFVQDGAGGLDVPIDLTFTPNGSLLVTSGFTGEVLEYDGDSGDFLGVYAEGLLIPTCIKVNPANNNILVCDFLSGEVLEIIDGKPELFADVDSDTGLITALAGIAFNPAENTIYISDVFNDIVWHYNQSGEFLGAFGDATNQGPVPLNLPGFMVFNQADGNLYISNEGDNLVSIYNGVTGDFQDFFDASPFFNTAIEGITIGPDANLYLADFDSGQVARFSLDGPTPEFIDIFTDGLGNPVGITFGPDECLFIANTQDSSVLRACEIDSPAPDAAESGGGCSITPSSSLNASSPMFNILILLFPLLVIVLIRKLKFNSNPIKCSVLIIPLLTILISSCVPIIAGGMIYGSVKSKKERQKFMHNLNMTNMERTQNDLPPLDLCTEKYNFDKYWAMKDPKCKEVVKRLDPDPEFTSREAEELDKMGSR